MRSLEIISHSEAQTVALATRLSDAFMPGDVVVLNGELGCGKTTFVRALAVARGVDEKLVNSPSYTFVNEYKATPPIYHFDLYRLQEPEELHEIGWDEYLKRDGLVVVEWGERARGLLPATFYLLQFDILGDTERKIELSRVTE
ncbi:tRNA (adenosine(37)-N6)-threonylcarbamoyltransferase complex ATPase subunit type 1 TsaE [candidate division GN15 bacterium]|nr:tRNA (adenosine(37)-N6)-threonylcarbamoyltransferase complex ATPase subunit type 1 TsaE [candidate division GN15 bacterium]